MSANYSVGGRGWGPPGPNKRGGLEWKFGGPPATANRSPFRGGRGNARGRGRGRTALRHSHYGGIPGKRLSEDEVGVTEYVSNHEGFQGLIKNRYSDFQVSEINERGEVAKLTTLATPQPVVPEGEEEDEELLNKYNTEILPTETWDRINKLLMGESDTRVEIDVTGLSKEERTKMHEAVKRAFGDDSVVGSTVAVGDKKFVTFDRFRKGARVDKRVKWPWSGEYVHFVLHKENIDTNQAALRLAERLRLNIKPSMLGYAGTKDRRAKTSQWFSLRKVDPKKIATAVHTMREIKVGNFSFSDTHIKLGMLQGNRFRLALRNVTAAEADVEAACAQLQRDGFVNYYGLQRFGTRAEVPTHTVGIKLLQRNFKEAVDLILKERPGALEAALRTYATEGPAAALAVWPKWLINSSLEGRVVKALADNPNDLVGALNKLARNTRLLYLHAYQSLVWNRSASERLRRHGLSPAVGDLVAEDKVVEELIPERFDIAERENSTLRSMATTESEETSEQHGDDVVNKMEDEDKMADEEIVESDAKIKVKVKALTERDIRSKKYSIFDVVLPLPGYQIEYPRNMKDFYEKQLADDGVSMDLDKKSRSYSVTGAYRHLVVRPTDMEWRIVKYTDPFCDLVASDWDEIAGQKIDGIVADGKYKALLLSMSLPASCYATMALRELLKRDTSGDSQAAQNNYHLQEPTESNGSGETETKEGEKRKADVDFSQDDFDFESKKVKQDQ